MRRMVTLPLLLASFVAFLPSPGAALADDKTRDARSETYNEKELEEAGRVLDQRLFDCNDANRCAGIYARIALLERPGGAVEHLAYERLETMVGRARLELLAIANDTTSPPEARARVIDYFRTHWSLLASGVDAAITEMVARALESESGALRAAAARLMAEKPIPRIGHFAIDATYLHPELTQAALLAVGAAGDAHVASFVVEQLASDDPLVAATARRVTWQLQRYTVERIKQAMTSDDAKMRAAAVDALLPIAVLDDLAALYRWLEQDGDGAPEVRDRVIRVIAELESGLYDPPPPPPVELDLARLAGPTKPR